MSYNNGTVKVKLTDGADMGDDDMPMYRAMYRTMRGLLNRRDANMFVIGFWCGQNPEVAADMFSAAAMVSNQPSPLVDG